MGAFNLADAVAYADRVGYPNNDTDMAYAFSKAILCEV